VESNEQVIELLGEIRDIQREQADQYRRLAEQSIELQQTGIMRYEQFQVLYRRVLVVCVVAVVLLIALLALLLFF